MISSKESARELSGLDVKVGYANPAEHPGANGEAMAALTAV
jgi:hypothetical protein